jgi:hypothetical protein
MTEIQITINIRLHESLMELAKKQYIESKAAGPTISIDRTPDTSSRAPDGAPWYAHNDGPCGPECVTTPEPPEGWAAHDLAAVRESHGPTINACGSSCSHIRAEDCLTPERPNGD